MLPFSSGALKKGVRRIVQEHAARSTELGIKGARENGARATYMNRLRKPMTTAELTTASCSSSVYTEAMFRMSSASTYNKSHRQTFQGCAI